MLSIGDVAASTGLSIHAIRFYEREDLFARPIPRTTGGRRAFEPADVEWLLMCSRFRASGMPIATIRRFVGLVRSGPGNEAERLALLREHERVVRSRIAELTENLAVIQHKVAVYEEHFRGGNTTGLWEPAP